MRESALYRDVDTYLNLRFASLRRPLFGEFFFKTGITAKSGPAASGQWTRPDLALITIWRNKYSLFGGISIRLTRTSISMASRLSTTQTAISLLSTKPSHKRAWSIFHMLSGSARHQPFVLRRPSIRSKKIAKRMESA